MIVEEAGLPLPSTSTETPEWTPINLQVLVERPLSITFSQILHWDGKLSIHENLSTGFFFFQKFNATTGLPPSTHLAVPSKRPPQTWLTDSRVQAEINLRVEKNSEAWHGEDANERDVILLGRSAEYMISNNEKSKDNMSWWPEKHPSHLGADEESILLVSQW